MVRKLIPIVLALAVMGAVTGIAAIMLVFLGQDWEDALFWILAAVMIGAALLVVTMRDIIRCGLAMMVCFGALAGIYVLIGAPLIAAAQVIVYIGAISVLILFAIMLTQTKDAPSRLVFQTQAVPAAIASIIIAVVIALAIGATDWGAAAKRDPARHRGAVAAPVQRLRPAVRDRQRPAPGGGDRRRLPRQARAGRAVVSDSLDAYLVLSGLLFAIGSFGFLARRNAISMLMSIELMLNGGQPRDRRVRRVHPGARRAGLGHRADRHRGGRRRGDGRPGHRHRHLPQQEDPARRRIRRDAPMSWETLVPLIAGLPLAASCDRAGRAAAGQAGALDPGAGGLRRVADRDGRRVLGADRHGAVRRGRVRRPAVRLDPGRQRSGQRRLLRRQPDRLPADRGDHDRAAGPRLLDRLHEPRPGLLAVLRLPQPVHVLDAAAGPGGQLPGRVRRLGAGRPVQLPADRLLVPQALGGAGRQEGVHRQPRRRRRVRPRDHADLRQPGHARHPRGDRPDRRARPDADHDHRAADLRRGDGQERPVPAPRLAARTRWKARPRCPP